MPPANWCARVWNLYLYALCVLVDQSWSIFVDVRLFVRLFPWHCLWQRGQAAVGVGGKVRELNFYHNSEVKYLLLSLIFQIVLRKHGNRLVGLASRDCWYVAMTTRSMWPRPLFPLIIAHTFYTLQARDPQGFVKPSGRRWEHDYNGKEGSKLKTFLIGTWLWVGHFLSHITWFNPRKYKFWLPT